MKKQLAIKQIYDDFTSKVILSNEELNVLIQYVKGDSIVKIASDTMQSTASVSRIIANIKKKYESYKELELAKLLLLK